MAENLAGASSKEGAAYAGKDVAQKPDQAEAIKDVLDKAEKPPKPEQPTLGITPDGVLMVLIPLDLVDRATARGVLLEADDEIKGWHYRRNQLREKIAQGNLNRQERGVLAKMGKLFTGGGYK